MWDWVKRGVALINRDVENPNESKKNAVMTRYICLIMGLYMIAQTVCLIAWRNYVFLFFSIGIFGFYVVAFYFTYSRRTVFSYYLVILLVLSWCFASTDLYGWSTGAQYGYCTLLIYVFNGTHRKLPRKMFDAGALLGIGVLTFILAMTGEPILLMTKQQNIIQEVLNMVSTFLCIALITVTFSQDTLMAEKKLMDYNKLVTVQAETDALTGLMNRRAGERFFEQISGRSLAEGFFVNVIMGDIDFFKQINDTYGHDAGDEVLRVLAGLFKSFTQGRGAAIRWGGEEFLFILFGMNGDDAFAMTQELREQIQKTVFYFDDQKIQVTMTFGIEECGREQNLEKLLEAADRKLYMGKARGRNQVVM